MDHYQVRCPSLFSRTSNLSLCLLHSDKGEDSFFQVALLLRLRLQLRLTFIICLCEDLFNVTVFQVKRKVLRVGPCFHNCARVAGKLFSPDGPTSKFSPVLRSHLHSINLSVSGISQNWRCNSNHPKKTGKTASGLPMCGCPWYCPWYPW